jgi:hypothetical protein
MREPIGPFGLRYWLSHIDISKKHKAQIMYIGNVKEIEDLKLLTDDLKKELKENDVEIFNGVIYSNKIPVRMRKMRRDEKVEK